MKIGLLGRDKALEPGFPTAYRSAGTRATHDPKLFFKPKRIEGSTTKQSNAQIGTLLRQEIEQARA